MTIDGQRPETTWETARLLARPAVTADAQAIFEHYACDPEVARYMTWRPHNEISETLDFLRRCERVWADGSAFPWSLWMKGSGEFVGLVEIRVHRTSVDLGYALSRRWWRQGLMSEALRSVLQWALAQPEIYRVWPRATLITSRPLACSSESVWNARGFFVDGSSIPTSPRRRGTVCATPS
jgi:RimJ/RimL family protein N-acetyltransferase